MSNQKDYWNKAAAAKYFTTPFHFNLFSKYVKESAMILDYGCGYGRTLFELKAHGYTHLYGVDFSEAMISRARQGEHHDVAFAVIGSGRLPFADRSMDAVLLFAVLTCVWQDREQDAILTEIKRVMKPGGILYINDFLLNTDARNVQRYRKYKDKYQTYGVFELPDGAVLRHHDEDRINAWTDGFHRLACKRVTYTTMNGHKSNGLLYIGQLK